jgi:hypothetical protein
MNLEYIALDQTIDRLVRRKPIVNSVPSKKAKGKGKQCNILLDLVMGTNTSGISSVPTWEAAIAGSAASHLESSDDEDEDGSLSRGLIVETLSGMRFCDITGVRIFEKDILNGYL